MANPVETLVATAAIQSSADRFYNFFRYNMTELVRIFPAAYTGAEVIEGQEGTVGCVVLWNYILGGNAMTAQVRTEAIDVDARSITWAAIEGDVLQLYRSFIVTLNVSEGLATWTIAYERASLITPPPELYQSLFVTVTTLVDAYLLTIN